MIDVLMDRVWRDETQTGIYFECSNMSLKKKDIFNVQGLDACYGITKSFPMGIYHAAPVVLLLKYSIDILKVSGGRYDIRQPSLVWVCPGSFVQLGSRGSLYRIVSSRPTLMCSLETPCKECPFRIKCRNAGENI